MPMPPRKQRQPSRAPGAPRIAAGTLKGVPLIVPPGVRATSSKVRQALFNILGDLVEGARVIDGFAGSGALGLEALSRGAAFVAFIESDTEAVLAIRDNLARLAPAPVQAPRRSRLLHLEAEPGLRQLAKDEAPFDLILLDPPYRTEEGKKSLSVIVECAMLVPAGIVAIEHDLKTALPASIGPLRQMKQHRYGDTVLSFYQ